MGSILSGSKGVRGGRQSTDERPKVRLTTHALYSAKTRRNGPSLILEGGNWATVTYGPRQWAIGLEYTPLHFGGHRRWLCCPECSQRRQALYILNGRLSCRVCLNLRYESQHENVRDRMFRRLYAIRERLGWKGGLDRPNGPKPLRMHRVTFNRLVAEHDSLAAMLLGCLGEWIERAELRGVRF